MRLDPLLRPGSVAVVGASPHAGPSRRVLENLRRFGFPGSVYPVNPRYQSVLGCPCYPSITALPETVHCAVLAVGSQRVPAVVEEAVSCQVGAVVVLSSGFGELGGRGEALQRRLESLSDRILIAGPNCMGLVNLVDRVAAYSGPVAGMTPGSVALVAQSGAIGCVLANAVEARGIGLSYHISAGNGLGVGVADYVEFLIDDPTTTVIGLYIESTARGRDVLTLASRARSAGKQVVLLHAGTSEIGRLAAASHSAAITASPEILEAGCRQAGVVLAHDLDEMIACLELCAHCTPPTGGEVAVVTISGGEAALLGDLASALRLPLATFTLETQAVLTRALPPYVSITNPLDSTGAGIVERDTEAYRRALEAVGRDSTVGLVVVAHDVNNGLKVRTGENLMLQDAVTATVEAAASSRAPYVLLSPATGPVDPVAAAAAREGNLPLLLGARPGMAAVAGLMAARHAAHGPLAPATPAACPRELSDQDDIALLAGYGIETPASRLAATSADAVAAARELGFPVALKIAADGLLHKSDIGGVILDLRDDTAVAAGFAALLERAAGQLPASAVRGVLVQRMAPAGVELLCGARYDAAFGQVVTLGFGGIYAEILDTVVIRLGPIDERDARAMIGELRGHELLDGPRGQAACDIEGVASALVGLSQLQADHGGAVREVELNPLLAPFGAPPLALDVLVLRAGTETTAEPTDADPSAGLRRVEA
jgi:acyl-CoA synthetase (NDP forming)